MLSSGPYTIANAPTIVKAWEHGFDFQKEILTVVPVWVQFPGLPLCRWGVHSLSRFGSLVGTPLYADENTMNQTRISYARIMVEVDLTGRWYVLL